MAASHVPKNLPTQTPPGTSAPQPGSVIAAVSFFCALTFIFVALFSGIGRVSFTVFAALDFLMGAGFISKAPFLMWLFWGLVFGGTFAFWLDAPLYGYRRQRALIALSPFLLLFANAGIVRLANPPAPMPAAPAAPPPAPPPVPNFAGTWDTGRWGDMTLQQDGAHVFGTYTYADGVLEGTTSPIGNSSRLTYRWRNRNGGSNGVGYFDLAAGGQSFSGAWAQGETLRGNGSEWSGRRTAAPPPPVTFSGVWDTEWGEMTLKQGVNTVTGTYEYGGGTIAGDVEGNVLRFHWVNRVTGQTGSGKFTLALYGKSFAGSWNEGTEPDASGTAWTGRRKETTAP